MQVLLFVNMTLEEDKASETKQVLSDMQRMLTRFSADQKSGQFAVYAQFTHDVEGGETRLNRDIATELIKKGLL